MFLDGFPGLAVLVGQRLKEGAVKGELKGLPGEWRPLAWIPLTSDRQVKAGRAWHDYEAALSRRLDRGRPAESRAQFLPLNNN